MSHSPPLCRDSPERARDEAPATDSPPFDMRDALEMLSPDVFLKRNAAIHPSILLSRESFLAVQRRLPSRFQSLRWRLLFGSEYHGFSHSALERGSAEERRAARGRERPAVLLIAAGSEGQVLIGAFLSGIPQQSGVKYTGSEETFVFCQEQSGASPSPIRFFSTDVPVANRYFLRVDNGNIFIGGGGKGPAIALHSDMCSVSCSTACPTFDLKQSLLLMSGEGEIVSGVTLEGGEPRAVVKAVQLWTIGDENFAAKHHA